MSSFQVNVINSFLRVGSAEEELLAGFQTRATERIVRMVAQTVL